MSKSDSENRNKIMRIYFEYDFLEVPVVTDKIVKPYKLYFVGCPTSKEEAAELHSHLEMILSDISGLQQLRTEDNIEKIRKEVKQRMKERMWYMLKRLDLADEFIPRRDNDNQGFSL